MLVGGDLGVSSLVVLVVAFLGSVIGFFVVRRQCRLSVARREEVKRLLLLASKEAARAELEATSGYCYSGYSYEYRSTAVAQTPSSRQLQYQCAVCFFPTTTRCAGCKTVRYCSGKCQIIHWRQGHKEECHPFITSNQINDVGDGSSQQVSKQEEYESCEKSFEVEGRHCAELVETFPEKPACSDSTHSKDLHGKDDNEVEYFTDGIGTNTSSEFTTRSSSEGFTASTTTIEPSVDASVSSANNFDTSDGHQSTNVVPDKFETYGANKAQIKPPVSKQSTLVNSVDSFTSSAKFNQIKPSCKDGHTHCVLSNSSGRSSDGSSDFFLSEPSTPSSDFSDRAIDSNKSRIDPLDDYAKSSSSDTRDDNISDSQHSVNFSFNLARNVDPPVEVQSSNTKTIISDDACPSTLRIDKLIGGGALSKETSEDGLKSGRSPSLGSEIFNHINVDTQSDSHISKSRDFKNSSSASYAHPASRGHSTSKDTSKVSSLRSLGLEGSIHVNNGVSGNSHTLKSRDSRSLSSKAAEAHLSSSNGRHSVQSENSVKVDSAQGSTVCSSQFGGYPQNSSNGLKTSMLKVVDQLIASKLSLHYPSGAGSEIAGRYNKGLFSYELFVKLYNWNRVELHPCGLTNCGNSCYANAVLQCLVFTPPLTAFLLQGLHSKACEKRDWCFTCEFESLVLKAKEGSSPLTPIRILSQLQRIGSHLGNGREEDAHEFLRYAIDTMQNVCLKEAGVKISGSLEEETTLIGLTFGGYLRSKIKCMKCGGKSERHERMMDLTVEIDGDIGTLEEALCQFTGTEILDGENKYQCSRCKSYEKAKKKLTVLEAPNVLTIALKRFQSGIFGKLNKPIQFPELLDLAPFMSGTGDKSPVYRLYGVVVHLDIMNAAFSGHYVCYVKNIQNKWFKIDDSTVKAVELENVLTKGAYMLLYARCSPHAPKLIRNSIVTRDPRKSKSRSHPTTSPWDFSKTDSLNGRISSEGFYPNHTSFQPIRSILEEDSSSENSSSLFSEGGSCSTDSSYRDSISTDDYFDQIFGDLGQNWNSHWRNSSDSDTLCSSPSSLCSRHSPLADLDRYASRRPETSCSRIDNAEEAVNDDRRDRVEVWKDKASVPFDSTIQYRKFVSSSSCRESDRLEFANRFDGMKPVVSLRRSVRERRD